MRATENDTTHRTPGKVNKCIYSARGTLTKEQTRLELDLPVETSVGIHLGSTLRSLRGVMIPSILPNMEERPRVKSMMKNNMAHTCEAGIAMTASVNAIKARPVPDADCPTKKEETRWCKNQYGYEK